MLACGDTRCNWAILCTSQRRKCLNGNVFHTKSPDKLLCLIIKFKANTKSLFSFRVFGYPSQKERVCSPSLTLERRKNERLQSATSAAHGHPSSIFRFKNTPPTTHHPNTIWKHKQTFPGVKVFTENITARSWWFWSVPSGWSCTAEASNWNQERGDDLHEAQHHDAYKPSWIIL